MGAARQIDAPEEAFLAGGVIAAWGGFLVFGGRGGATPGHGRPGLCRNLPRRADLAVRPPQASLDRAGLVAVVPRPDGYLALGWALAEDTTGVPAAWRSVDGLTWDRVPGLGGVDRRLTGAALADGRVLVRGTIDDGNTPRAVSWESSDGFAWTRLPLGADIPDLLGTMPSDPVTVGGQRFAVATLDDGSPSARAVVLVEEAIDR